MSNFDVLRKRVLLKSTKPCCIVLRWKVRYYKNSDDAQGGQTDFATYPDGFKVMILDQWSMTRPNYDFIGWNTQKNGLGKWYLPDGFIALYNHANLYAQWQEYPVYFVYYNDNSLFTSGGQDDNTRYYENEVATVLNQGTIATNDQTRAFQYWTDSSGTIYYPGDTIVVGISNVQLYANYIYVRQSMKLQLNPRGGVTNFYNANNVLAATSATPIFGYYGIAFFANSGAVSYVGSSNVGFQFTDFSKTDDAVYGVFNVNTTSILYDSSQNAVRTVVTSGGADVCVVKYTGQGQFVFLLRIRSASSGNEFPSTINTDPKGNVYLVGTNSSDMTLSAYNADDSIYSTVINSTIGQGNNAFIVKYNSSGTVTGIASFQGLNDQNIYVFADSKFVYVSGRSRLNTITLRNGTNSVILPDVTDSDGFVMKLTSIGDSSSPVWFARVSSTGNDFGKLVEADYKDNVYVVYVTDAGTDLVLYDAGNFFTARLTVAKVSNYLTVLAKYNSSGVVQWAVGMHSAATPNNHLICVTRSTSFVLIWITSNVTLTDTQGVFISLTLPVGYTSAAFIVKYNSNGVYLSVVKIVNVNQLGKMYCWNGKLYLEYDYLNATTIYYNNTSVVFGQTNDRGNILIRFDPESNTPTFLGRSVTQYNNPTFLITYDKNRLAATGVQTDSTLYNDGFSAVVKDEGTIVHDDPTKKFVYWTDAVISTIYYPNDPILMNSNKQLLANYVEFVKNIPLFFNASGRSVKIFNALKVESGSVSTAGSIYNGFVIFGPNNVPKVVLFSTMVEKYYAPTTPQNMANDYFYATISISAATTLYDADDTPLTIADNVSTTTDFDTAYDSLLLKYSTSGVLQWYARISSATTNVRPGTVVEDASGNAYIGGTSNSGTPLIAYNADKTAYTPSIDTTTGQGINSYIVKYSPTGTVLGAASFEGSNTQIIRNIYLDTNNSNLYVCGYSRNFVITVRSGSYTFNTIACNGCFIKLVWVESTARFEVVWYTVTSSASLDVISRIVSDSNGNVYTSTYASISTNINVFDSTDLTVAKFTGVADASKYLLYVAKHNSAGIALWAVGFNTLNQQQSSAISVDTSGNCFVPLTTSSVSLKDTAYNPASLLVTENTPRTFTLPAGFIPLVTTSAIFIVKLSSTGVYLAHATIVNIFGVNSMSFLDGFLYLDCSYQGVCSVFLNGATTGIAMNTSSPLPGCIKIKLSAATLTPLLVGYYTS